MILLYEHMQQFHFIPSDPGSPAMSRCCGSWRYRERRSLHDGHRLSVSHLYNDRTHTHRWGWVHVSVFICMCPANLHWSDLSNSLGDSISTFTHFWLELEGLWYRPWTGTVALCFPERKTSAVKPEDRYSGASRSTFESRRTYKTCSSSSQLKCIVNKYSYAKYLAWYWNRSPLNRCLVLEFPADIHPCKLHLAAFGPVKLSHHDLLFPIEHCIGDPYKPNHTFNHLKHHEHKQMNKPKK